MNRELYLKSFEDLKAERKNIDDKFIDLRNNYIESCKPCNIGDNVRIKLNSDRIVTGEVLSFGILLDKNVHITSYKNGNKTLYITIPNKEVVLINN